MTVIDLFNCCIVSMPLALTVLRCCRNRLIIILLLFETWLWRARLHPVQYVLPH